jgi:nucleoid DNA-binding protein
MPTLTQAQLLNKTLEVMEDDLRIPKKNAKDFIDSLSSVIEETIAEGDKVSLFGLVNLTPVGIPAKPKRKGTDRATGEEKWLDPTPAKVRVKAGVVKRVKEAAPEPTDKAGKRLIAEAKERQRKAAERAAKREAEEAAQAKKSSGGKKSSAKKSK